MIKKIALIGATGSIGKQVCAIVRRHPDKFKIESMVANASAQDFCAEVFDFYGVFASFS